MVGSSLIRMSPTTVSAMEAIRGAVRTCLEKLEPGAKIIVACSGGADSLALSYALAKEAPKLAIEVMGITIDHQLQSGSGQQAARTIEQLAAMGISRSQVIKVKVELTDGMEASARRARYLALAQAARNYGGARVFLGHTQDDQAETVLLGLARGSGTRSLSGMAAQSGIYLRPLLGATRAQSLAACAEVNLTPWSDPQNQDQSFLRVRLRTQAIPVLESAIGPGIALALARSAGLARDDADALDEWANREFGALKPDSLEIKPLQGLPRAVRTRIFRLAIYAAGAPSGSLSVDHVLAVEALVTNWSGQGEVSLPGGVKARRISGRLSLLPPPVTKREA